MHDAPTPPHPSLDARMPPQLSALPALLRAWWCTVSQSWHHRVGAAHRKLSGLSGLSRSLARARTQRRQLADAAWRDLASAAGIADADKSAKKADVALARAKLKVCPPMMCMSG
jgi:hypothetical protein